MCWVGRIRVRRAWLCGEDRESGRSYEHRRQWVEDRIGELAGIFAVAVWGYAVMSNHLEIRGNACNNRRGRVVEAQRLAASVAYRISVKLPVRQLRFQRRQTPAASSRPWRLRSSCFRKPPGVADALHPALVDGFGFLHHCLDAADDAPVR